jgi:hypothetical protein
MRTWSRVLVATATFCLVAGSYALPAQAGGKWRAQWAFGDHGDHGSSAGNSGGSSSGGYAGNGGSWSSGSLGGSSHSGGSSGGSRGAPGPIAGAGLPFLVMAGAYALVRRYCKSHMAA